MPSFLEHPAPKPKDVTPLKAVHHPCDRYCRQGKGGKQAVQVSKQSVLTCHQDLHVARKQCKGHKA